METGSGGGGGRLLKTESAEMRWVVPGGSFEEDEIESSDDGGTGADTPPAALGSRGGGGSGDEDYEEDEMLHQRLVRMGPRADSQDVEALDVPGVYRHQAAAPQSTILPPILLNLRLEEAQTWERLMDLLPLLPPRPWKKCDHAKMYERISDENLALMREWLMAMVIWPTDDTDTEKIG